MKNKNIWLWVEFLALAVGVPLLFFFYINRPLMMTTLWGGAVVALLYLRRQPEFNWRTFWHGSWHDKERMPAKIRNLIFMRFVIGTAFVIALSLVITPDRMFMLITERPQMWVLIMVLYPLLSVLPQEIIYRSFFFARYQPIISPKYMVWASALSFGLLHILFHNWVAPVLSAIGGWMFAAGYKRDGSLKWAVIEHAFYGCMVFTVGLGWFFYLGAWR